jgi:hypothetical protein
MKKLIFFLFGFFIISNVNAEIIKLLCIQDKNKNIEHVYFIDTDRKTVDGEPADISSYSFFWIHEIKGGGKFFNKINRTTGKYSGTYLPLEGKTIDLLTSTCNLAPPNKF